MHIDLTNDKAVKDANTESSDTSTDEKDCVITTS